jgi:hypothetical protein
VLLVGVKQTLLFAVQVSAFDPEQKGLVADKTMKAAPIVEL